MNSLIIIAVVLIDLHSYGTMLGPAMKNIDESGSIDYIDRWISGASVKKRPAFMQMIDNIKLQYKTLTNQ